MAWRFRSFLEILPHQCQNRLHYRLPRSRVRDPRDLLRHLHRFRGQVRCAFSVDVEGFQRLIANMRVSIMEASKL
jgi:hypothetical protein